MSEQKPVPPLDTSKLELPSDQVKLGQLRTEQPGLFRDSSDMMDHRFLDTNAFGMVSAEIELAETAYAKALGQTPDPGNLADREERLDLLNVDYKRYGLSTGLQQTRQMIRRVEAAARKQAEAHIGKGR